jgi:hypothetical protein
MASNTTDTYKVGLDSFHAFRVEYNLDLIWPTAFTFAFHGFLRVGEIVYTKPGPAHQIIGLQDVTFVKVGDLQSIKVLINHSKNDQIGKGVYIYISMRSAQKYVRWSFLISTSHKGRL